MGEHEREIGGRDSLIMHNHDKAILYDVLDNVEQSPEYDKADCQPGLDLGHILLEFVIGGVKGKPFAASADDGKSAGEQCIDAEQLVELCVIVEDVGDEREYRVH